MKDFFFSRTKKARGTSASLGFLFFLPINLAVKNYLAKTYSNITNYNKN